ncbi:MAG: helicase C-terminal domain-containing protein [Methanothrix sp.]
MPTKFLIAGRFLLAWSRRGGAVLTGVCGGKLAEGIDYKGEALNGVAVVGLPLAAYDEIQKEINGYYTKNTGKTKGMLIAYTLPAMNRGLQAAGRVIRAESERGILLFCDRRFGDDNPAVSTSSSLMGEIGIDIGRRQRGPGNDQGEDRAVEDEKIPRNLSAMRSQNKPAIKNLARGISGSWRSPGAGDTGQKSRSGKGDIARISGFGQK